MRSAGAVRQKLKQVRFRHLKQRIAADLQQCPVNCKHNVLVDLPRTPAVRVCTHGPANGDSGAMAPCDERWDHGERAASCPFFTLRRDKDQIKADFKAEILGMSLAHVAQDYPDMAALMWVLGDEGEGVWDDEDEAVVVPSPPPPPPLSSEPSALSDTTLSWSGALWRWLQGFTTFKGPRLVQH